MTNKPLTDSERIEIILTYFDSSIPKTTAIECQLKTMFDQIRDEGRLQGFMDMAFNRSHQNPVEIIAKEKELCGSKGHPFPEEIIKCATCEEIREQIRKEAYEQGYAEGVRDEQVRIKDFLLSEYKGAWSDAIHCSCLPAAIATMCDGRFEKEVDSYCKCKEDSSYKKGFKDACEKWEKMIKDFIWKENKTKSNFLLSNNQYDAIVSYGKISSMDTLLFIAEKEGLVPNKEKNEFP